MAWIGYYEYGGTEVINASRTEAYAANSGLGWFRAAYKNEALQLLLGDRDYSSPLQDDAPWTDYRDPDTYDFLGAYPLSVEGVEDSTWSAAVTENTGDGGVVGRVRKGTKTVVFQVALIGRTVCGAEAGMRWLREALGGRPCLAPNECTGHDMCYLRCEPHLDMTEYRPEIVYTFDENGDVVQAGRNPPDDLTDCYTEFLRTLRNVTFTIGPTIQEKKFTADGGAVWIVAFTAVAGNPYEWGQETPLIQGFMDPTVNVPYVDGIVPDGGMFDADGYVQTEVACPVVEYQPVYDPACPFVIPPPGVPSVDITCFDFPVNYIRRQFVIPESSVPTWGEVVPFLQIRAPTYEVRSLRLRFYSDVLGGGDPATDPCNFCGDIVFSYIPANSTLVFDGSDRAVYLQTPGGGKRRADSLVFGSDGTPFEWPELSCGVGYIVTLDLPQTQQPPIVDMSLYSRAS